MISTDKSPLTQSDRELIATIVSRSDFHQPVTANQIVTIQIVDGCVWVKLFKCWVCFDFAWFKAQVVELKSQLTGFKPGVRLQPKPKCLTARKWYYGETLVWIGRCDRSSFWVHDCRQELGILCDSWEEAKQLRKHILNRPQHSLLTA